MSFGESQSVPKNKFETTPPQDSEGVIETVEEEADSENQPAVASPDNVIDLKSRLKITTEEYQARLAANEDARKKLAVLGKEFDLGAAGEEEETLRKSMEEAQSKIDSLEAVPGQSGIEAGAEQGEISAEAIEAQLKEMPENEQKKIEVGMHNIGFFGQKLKSEMLGKTLDFGANLVDKDGITGKFLKSLSGTYKKDAELAERKIVNSESDEGKAATKWSNLGKTASGLLKIATWIGRGPSTAVASVFSRGMEMAKEVRLGDEKVMEKTRIADMDAAYTEAMKIHKEAEKSSKGSEPSKIDLQRAYEKNIPKDVLERLGKNYQPGDGSNFLSGLMRKPMEFSAQRLNKQIESIENNEKLSDAEREAKKNNLLDNYSKRLTDLDRMVSQTGELDTIATGLKYAEVAGKAIMAGLMAKTAYEMLQKAWNSMPEILEALGPKSASAAEFPAGFSATKGNAGAMFRELENQTGGKPKMSGGIGESVRQNADNMFQEAKELESSGSDDLKGMPGTHEGLRNALANEENIRNINEHQAVPGTYEGLRDALANEENIRNINEHQAVPGTHEGLRAALEENDNMTGEHPRSTAFTQEDLLKAMEKNPERFELIRQQHKAFDNDIFLNNGKEKLMSGIQNPSLARSRAGNIINKLFSEWHMRFIDGAVSEKDYANHLEKLNKQYGGVFDVKRIMSLKK